MVAVGFSWYLGSKDSTHGCEPEKDVKLWCAYACLCVLMKKVHYDFIQWYSRKQLYTYIIVYIYRLARKESSQVHTPVPPPTVHRTYISHRQNTENHIPKFQHPNVQNINCRIVFSQKIQKHHGNYFTSSLTFFLCFFVKHVLTILFE